MRARDDPGRGETVGMGQFARASTGYRTGDVVGLGYVRIGDVRVWQSVQHILLLRTIYPSTQDLSK